MEAVRVELTLDLDATERTHFMEAVDEQPMDKVIHRSTVDGSGDGRV